MLEDEVIIRLYLYDREAFLMKAGDATYSHMQPDAANAEHEPAIALLDLLEHDAATYMNRDDQYSDMFLVGDSEWAGAGEMV